MLNPIVALLQHHNPFQSPIVVHRCKEGTTIDIRSPLRSRDWYSHHVCNDNPEPQPMLNVRFRDRTVTLFASDACLAISHKAPRAYYRDEVRITDMWQSGPLPQYPTWTGDAFYRYLQPLGLRIDTAARQERGLAKYKAEHPAPAEST